MKIAIVGFGKEGEANYKYFSSQYPSSEIVIVDEREEINNLPSGVETILGKGAFEKLGDFDLVVRTAGVSPKKIKTSGKTTSSTKEFFKKCNVPIIGVTGTKGKGTTCSLITSLLRAAGKSVLLVGNIGVPAISQLSKLTQTDVVVYELSSFQLWDLDEPPQIALIGMVEPDHLDAHGDLDDYLSAKANIVRYQEAGDDVFYYSDNELTEFIAKQGKNRPVKYPSRESFFVQDDWFVDGENGQKICQTSELKLPGEHNINNACGALASAKAYLKRCGEDLTPEAAKIGLNNFLGLEHRLKYVDTIANVEFYNDSIATTPGSAVAAVKSFDQAKVLILGGSDKGGDYNELVEIIIRTPSIEKVILVGQNAKKIYSIFSQHEGSSLEKVLLLSDDDYDIDEVVEKSFANASPGGVVIFSPAASSFGFFANYKDRGEKFILAVKKLKDAQDATDKKTR